MTLASTRSDTAPPRGATRPPRRGLRVLAVLAVVAVLAAVLLPVVTAAYVVWVAQQDDRSSSDAIVVLGAAQYWNRPSPVLEARLAHARALHDDGVAPRIVTVGGKRPGDNTTEAKAGRDWLVDNGVPRSDVTAVSRGDDTLTSLTAVAELMAAHGWDSATLVTDPAHEARSLAMARALGIDARPSPTPDGPGSSVTADYVVRETGGLLQFWLRDRADLPQLVGAESAGG